MTRWEPDPLGAHWQQTTLDLGADDEGAVVATVVRAVPDGTAVADRPAVLYVHGFNDYFFQTHLGEALRAHGYELYALDLRKCGRSLRPWQTPHSCADLLDYVPELTAAAALVRGELGHRRLVLMGHSTGGLLASLWAHSLRETDVLDALVLNSPWFDLNARWFQRVVATRVLDVAGPLDPKRVLADGPSEYSYRLHVAHGGVWDYDLTLKPPEGFPVRAGWLRAVRRGQARLARGLDIAVPVLVCSSASSGPNNAANPDLDRQDTILDVRQIATRSALLGPDVTLVRIPDGVHDLSLSAPAPRALYLETVTRWLEARVPAPEPGRADRAV